MANRNNQSDYKSSNKKWAGFWAGAIALIIVVAILAGVMGWRTTGFKDWTFGFGSPTISAPDDKPDNIDNTTNDNNLIIAPETGASALSYSLEPLTEKASDGSVKVVKDSYTITITYTPSYLKGVKIDWSANWVNASNVWVAGRQVSDFVSIAPTDEYGLTAEIRTDNAFAEQIRVKAAAHSNPEVNISFYLDYLQSVTCSSPSIGCTDFSDGFSFDTEINLGTGTTLGAFEVMSLDLTVSDEFEADFKSRLNFSVKLKSSVDLNSYLDIETQIQPLDDRTLFVIEGQELEWEWFFLEFDSYTQEQKNAIYYAWFNTWLDGNYQNKGNIDLSVKVYYTYLGVNICTLNGTELIARGQLSGDTAGSEIKVSSLGGAYNLVFY